MKRDSARWLALELVVIVLGILIAYQVESWRDARVGEARVQEGLSTLLSSMEEAAGQDSLFAMAAIARADAASELLQYLQEPGRTSDSILALFGGAIFRRSYGQNSLPWFRAMQENGTLALVTDEELKADLLAYHDGTLGYLSSLIAELEAFELRLIETSSPDIGPCPGSDVTEYGTRVFDWTLKRPASDIPTDPAFSSALGWVARRSSFAAVRVLQMRDENGELRSRLRRYLESR